MVLYRQCHTVTTEQVTSENQPNGRLCFGLVYRGSFHDGVHVTSGQREGPAFFSWFLVSIGADLGSHGRPPGLFDSCLIFSITSRFSWCRRRSFCDGVHRDQWTKGRTSFLFMISCHIWGCDGWFCGNVYRDH
uniref:Uncharacterized protein n=1 Tax=Fagus sylvatica TaxID=28930 RepID=A0A2N9I573_FAGSY